MAKRGLSKRTIERLAGRIVSYNEIVKNSRQKEIIEDYIKDKDNLKSIYNAYGIVADAFRTLSLDAGKVADGETVVSDPVLLHEFEKYSSEIKLINLSDINLIYANAKNVELQKEVDNLQAEIDGLKAGIAAGVSVDLRPVEAKLTDIVNRIGANKADLTTIKDLIKSSDLDKISGYLATLSNKIDEMDKKVDKGGNGGSKKITIALASAATAIAVVGTVFAGIAAFRPINNNAQALADGAAEVTAYMTTETNEKNAFDDIASEIEASPNVMTLDNMYDILGEYGITVPTNDANSVAPASVQLAEQTTQAEEVYNNVAMSEIDNLKSIVNDVFATNDKTDTIVLGVDESGNDVVFDFNSLTQTPYMQAYLDAMTSEFNEAKAKNEATLAVDKLEDLIDAIQQIPGVNVSEETIDGITGAIQDALENASSDEAYNNITNYINSELIELSNFYTELGNAQADENISETEKSSLETIIKNYSATDNASYGFSTTGEMEASLGEAMAKQDLNKLQIQYDNLDNAINGEDGYLKQIENLKNEIAEMGNMVSQEKYNELKAKYDGLDSAINGAGGYLDQIENLKKQLDNAGSSEEAEELRKQLTATQNKLTEANKQLGEVNSQLESLKNENADLKDENATLKGQVEELKADISELNSTIAELENDISNLTADNQDLLNNYNSVLKKYNEAQSKLDEEIKKYNELADKYNLQVEANDELEDLFNEQREKLVTAQNRVAELESQLSQVESNRTFLESVYKAITGNSASGMSDAEIRQYIANALGISNTPGTTPGAGEDANERQR